jgi:hypothetical protein
MLRATRAAAGMAVLLVGGVLLAQPKDAPADNYFPLKVKSKWTYKVGDNDVTVSVVKVDKVGNEDHYQVDTYVGKEAKPGEAKTSEWYVVRADGIYRTKVKDDKLDPNVKVLPLPVKKDAAWDLNSKLGQQAIKGTLKVKDEKAKVKTPAGEYEAVLVEGDGVDVAGAKTVIRLWFAKNLGIVKEEVSVAGGEKVLVELFKYEEGK